MDDDWLDSFCGSTFWDLNVTWYTDYPDLTPCFQKTVLVWLPCAFLWAFSPLELFYMFNSKNKNIPWNWRNFSKAILTGFLVILSIVDLGYAISEYSDIDSGIFSVDIYTPLIKAVTFLLATVLVVYNRRKGLRTSGLLFLFWFILLLFGCVQFRYEVQRSQSSGASDYLSISYVIYYAVSLIIFFLNFFVDLPPKEEKYERVENLCPQYSSPFQSRLFFSFFDSLVWKGFRNPLEVKVLWNLNHEDLCKEIVPTFDYYYEKSIKKHELVPGLKASFGKTSGSIDFKNGKKKKSVSVLPALCKAFGPAFVFGMGLRFIGDLLTFASPEILKYIIAFVQNDEPMWKGYFYAVLMFVVVMLLAVINSHYNYRMLLVGQRVRAAVISAVYRKALRMSNNSRKISTVGEIVNLMSVDCQRLLEVTGQLNMLWSAPFQILLSLIFLWQNMGIAVLPSVVIMIILIPINSVLANKSKVLQVRQMKSKDVRIKVMNEILNGIKVLKMYAWEPSFEKQIHKIREKEVKVLKDIAYLNGATSFIWTCAPVLMAVSAFTTYILISEDNVLDAQIAFVSIALFNIVRMPLAFIPMLVASFIQANVSLQRINKFMCSEEIDPNNVDHDEHEKHPLLIQNGNFSWGSEEEAVLKNVNLKVQKGSLVAVVGTVGSGKSSLISALLGEMDKINGRVNTKGSIAYVPQQAWMQNATLKDNITFGLALDDKLYIKVIDSCALKSDLEMLPGGDQTEIGEKGINLSGGQKQRVSLARAVYRLTDIYLFDDPLSAVDSHVGKHIFEKVIGPTGMLNNKTRVLVTHGITYLPDVDLIVVLKDGEITEQGTYKELLQSKGAFSEFLEEHLQEIIANEETSETEFEELKQHLEKTMGVEEFRQTLNRAISKVSERSEAGSLAGGRSRQGSIHRKISVVSGKSFGSQRNLNGSLRILSASNRNLSASNGSIGRSNKNLNLIQRLNSVSSAKHKSTEKINKIKDEKPGGMKKNKLIEAEKAQVGNVKLAVYMSYFKAIGFFLVFNTIFWYSWTQAFTIGGNMWLSVWSENQLGEFNETTNEIVTNPQDLYLIVYGVLGLGQVITTVLAVLAISIGAINAAQTLHEKLLSNVLRLPQSMFDTTPTGRILTRFSSDVNVLDVVFPLILRFCIPHVFRVLTIIIPISYATPIFLVAVPPIAIIYYFVQKVYIATSRQLKRLESIARAPIYSHFGESITGAPTIRAYNMQHTFVQESENKVDINQKCYFPSIIASSWLSIRLELIGGIFIFCASLFAVLGRETMNPGLVGLSVSYSLQITMILNMLVRLTTEVETNIVAVERVKEYSELTQEAAWDNSSYQPSKHWPEDGRVEFKNYEVRYREGLDLVLKGINFSVTGGEKIGIVGRTGAGKSSLTLALFRIVEAAGGSIIIDDMDISKLGLHALRSRLTIIPQDPVLFSGTLRMNLDPFMSHSDDELWKALEHAHLKYFVESLPSGLSHQVSEGGENLSVGQRQLVCLARALLRKTKVLVLDEATAAVDLETDDLIQETIRKEFSDCTVLTIAHRLNTIVDADRVIVLDKGQVIEFDKPQKLLHDKSSVFHGMAKDAGLV